MKFFNTKDWREVSEENKEILEDYSDELESQGRSPKTIYQYQTDIKGFLCWNKVHNKNKYLLDLKRKDFIKFQLVLVRAGTSNARVNRLQSSLRNMLQYCVIEEDDYADYQINPMNLIKGLEKKSVREIYFLTDEEVNYLIYYFLLHDKPHIALWVSLCYDTAARRNEILQVEKSNMLTSQITNEVIGKRGKQFPLTYSKRTQKIASVYLAKRGKDKIKDLWIIGQGKHKHTLKYSTFYDWARLCAKLLNEKENKDYKFGPHVFRHSALERYSDGTHYFLRSERDGGKMDINALKTLAHHSDISTTQSYLQDKDLDELESYLGVGLTK